MKIKGKIRDILIIRNRIPHHGFKEVILTQKCWDKSIGPGVEPSPLGEDPAPNGWGRATIPKSRLLEGANRSWDTFGPQLGSSGDMHSK